MVLQVDEKTGLNYHGNSRAFGGKYEKEQKKRKQYVRNHFTAATTVFELVGLVRMHIYAVNINNNALLQ